MQSAFSALQVFQLSIKMDGKTYCRLWASKKKSKTEKHFLLYLFLAYPAKEHSGCILCNYYKQHTCVRLNDPSTRPVPLKTWSVIEI